MSDPQGDVAPIPPKPVPGVTVQMGFQWVVRTPSVYRYMDGRYVDEFFKSGKLRLSSFARFHQHKDEQRGDPEEGQATVTGTHAKSKHSIVGIVLPNQSSFILCGTTIPNPQTMSAFGNGCIRIVETMNFALAIAQSIPYFRGGIEGHCIYQPERMFERTLSYDPLPHLAAPGEPGSVDLGKLSQGAMALNSPDIFLLKRDMYSHQSEYRFVWYTRGPVPQYLDIECPDAIQFCERVLG